MAEGSRCSSPASPVGITLTLRKKPPQLTDRGGAELFLTAVVVEGLRSFVEPRGLLHDGLRVSLAVAAVAVLNDLNVIDTAAG